MNPIFWPVIAILFLSLYLGWVLVVEFRRARLDMAVAPADADLHNDPSIWTHEAHNKRIAARRRAAVIRWVVVCAVLLPVSFLMATFGGVSGIGLAVGLPTTTQTRTVTPTHTPSPTLTRTATQPLIRTYIPPTSAATPIVPTSQVIYKDVIKNVPVTVRVTTIITRIVTRVYVATPGKTQTPWIIYMLVTMTPSATLAATPTETLTWTPTVTPTETETPTSTVTPTETEMNGPP